MGYCGLKCVMMRQVEFKGGWVESLNCRTSCTEGRKAWCKLCAVRATNGNRGKLETMWVCHDSEPIDGMFLCLVRGRNCFKKHHVMEIQGIDYGKIKVRKRLS